MKMQVMTDRLAMMIESLVDYMGVSVGSGERSLLRYDRALPFIPELLEEMSLTTPTQFAYQASQPEEEKGRDLKQLMLRMAPPTQLDFSFITGVNSDGTSTKVKWAVHRVRSISPKLARGATMVVPRMFEAWVAMVQKDATYQEARRFLAWHNGQWRWASARHPVRHVEFEGAYNAGVATWLHSEVTESWQTILGYEGSPRIRFATTPQGVLDCFRLRDIPNGKSRRAALLHWVEQHWRRKPGSDSDERAALVEVRRHLRGARSFAWNGLSCEIVPKANEERESE